MYLHLKFNEIKFNHQSKKYENMYKLLYYLKDIIVKFINLHIYFISYTRNNFLNYYIFVCTQPYK